MRNFHGMLGTITLLGSLAFIGIGCGAQGGKTVMTQGANAEAVMGVAPEAGQYALYTAASLNPTATVNLKQGDPLGFRRGDDSHLIAVAGEQSFDLPKGTSQAYWKIQKH